MLVRLELRIIGISREMLWVSSNRNYINTDWIVYTLYCRFLLAGYAIGFSCAWLAVFQVRRYKYMQILNEIKDELRRNWKVANAISDCEGGFARESGVEELGIMLTSN